MAPPPRHGPYSSTALRQIVLVSFLISIPGAFFVPQPGLQRVWAVPCFTVGWSLWVSVVSLGIVPRMNRLRLPYFVAGVAVSYLAMVFLGFATSLALYLWVTEGIPPWSGPTLVVLARLLASPSVTPWVGGALVIALAVTFLHQVSRLMGPGVMAQWVTGRYRTPCEEERWFMFLDMRDSTSLAEQLGDVRFSLLVQEFLGDLSGPVLATGGEVSHYIGDEAVLTWRPRGKGAGARCLNCFFLFGDALERKRAGYEAKYGLLPRFKAGVHFGKVVATQVGEIKAEIVFHGDVLNTAARIQAQCDALGADFLVSEEAWHRVEPKDRLIAKDHGEVSLKGKLAPVRVFEVARS